MQQKKLVRREGDKSEIAIKVKGREERETEKSNEATIKKEVFSLCSNMTLNSS